MNGLRGDILGDVTGLARCERRPMLDQQDLAGDGHGCASDIGPAHIQADRPCPRHFPDSPGNFINARYSRFPAAPSIGDSIVPTTSSPIFCANSTIPATASRRSFSSLTTPPLPTLPLPTSNCALINATISARGATSASTAGITSRNEIKLVSILTSSAAPANTVSQ